MDILVGIATGIATIRGDPGWLPISLLFISSGLYAHSASGRLFKLPWIIAGLITSALFHASLIFTVSFPIKPPIIQLWALTVGMIYLLMAQLPIHALGWVDASFKHPDNPQSHGHKPQQ